MQPQSRHLADQFFNHSLLNAQAHIHDREIVSLQPSRKKVCIYGAGLLRNQAPLRDPDWEVWALNLVAPLDNLGRLRADRWFDIHQRCAQTADDLRWIKRCPFPIYVPEDLLDGSPNAVRFPLQEIEEHFKTTYWTCTFAYQIALVLYEGRATDLGLYGVELMHGTLRERTVEWACVAYWLGRALERGLKVHLPRGSMLGQHQHRYGFEYQPEIDAVDQYVARMDTQLRAGEVNE